MSAARSGSALHYRIFSQQAGSRFRSALGKVSCLIQFFQHLLLGHIIPMLQMLNGAQLHSHAQRHGKLFHNNRQNGLFTLHSKAQLASAVMGGGSVLCKHGKADGAAVQMPCNILQPVIAGMISLVVPDSMSSAGQLFYNRVDPRRILVAVAQKNIGFCSFIRNHSTKHRNRCTSFI